MNMLFRLLASLPKNASFPAVAALAAWYAGAKYGAPEMYLNAIDGVLAMGGDLVGSWTGGEGGADGGAGSDG